MVKMKNKGEKINCFNCNKFCWLDIGRVEDYEVAPVLVAGTAPCLEPCVPLGRRHVNAFWYENGRHNGGVGPPFGEIGKFGACGLSNPNDVAFDHGMSGQVFHRDRNRLRRFWNYNRAADRRAYRSST